MASDASTSLLSLTGTVEELLLSFVSVGEGGVQAVLNLREVCSTTKRWVDTLRSAQSKRIFSSRHAKMELSVETLEKFLEAPPPSGLSGDRGVTSLCLTQTDSLSDHRFPPEKEQLWSRFVAFWAPKLESLEVDVLFLPLNLKLGQLLFCSSLRSLRCNSVRHIDGRSTELPEMLFRFEKLSVYRLELEISQKQEFYSRLLTQENLRHLTLETIEKKEDLSGIVDLIEIKKDAEDFTLSLKVDLQKLDEIINRDWDGLTGLCDRFATSVANSSSSIRIWGLHEDEILECISEEVEQETARKFFKRILGLTGFFFSIPLWDVSAADFPNLVTYTLTSWSDDVERLETLEATAFPPNLKKLQVEDGLPRPASLPATLTHLDLMHNLCSVNGLLQGLLSLAKDCPSLRNLKMKWEHFDEHNGTERDPSYGFQSFTSSTQFKDLKSLDFCAEIEHSREAAVCRMIILHGFKLSQLNLRDLKLSFKKPIRVVDHNILIALISGPISKSLWNVDIDPRYVAKDAHPLLEIIKSTAAENKRKRVETHGKERGKEFNR